jgi:hypothetical protein
MAPDPSEQILRRCSVSCAPKKFQVSCLRGFSDMAGSGGVEHSRAHRGSFDLGKIPETEI